ncbi:unnamed protein product [Lactuca saligna]|uniref:Uncharacterized protein n=1 Tax=Lactuca saligna TaxID=75948 RepID=A0AA35Z1J4_LACSI|nr:unnamed protein product [Lactuca saligna]
MDGLCPNPPMASSSCFSSSLNRSSMKSIVNNPKACDCGSMHYSNLNEGKCKYWRWLDVEPVHMSLKDVVEEMNVELVALKTRIEKVKEDMEQMKKEQYSYAIAMKKKLYKFTIRFLFLIIAYMMK